MKNIRVSGIIDLGHSWGVVNSSMANAFLGKNKKICVSPIGGYNCLQNTLDKYIHYFIGNIHIDFSYTNPHNFSKIFSKRSKVKIGMTNYETNIVPIGWKDCENFVDILYVNSEYCKNNFIEAGFSNVKVKRLGTSIRKVERKSEDEFVFLNVSSPHARKRIDQVVRCYYKSFSKNDNVRLILKTGKTENLHYSVDVTNIIRHEQSKFPRRSSFPPISVIFDSVKDMSEIYSKSDCLISCSASEGFGMPMLEALSLNKQVIAPNYSGQKDFLDDKNSFLIPVEEIVAPKSFQYWHYKKNAKVCKVEDDDVVDLMRDVYSGSKKDFLFDKERFSWDTISEEILKDAESC